MRGVLFLLLVIAMPLQAQRTHALIVSGVGGDPRLSAEFQQDAEQLRMALEQRYGASVTVLTERTTPRSDKPAINAAVSRIATQTNAGDAVLLVFIGHGSAQGDVARINIPGPDITAAELAVLLEQLKGRTTAVVLATSASGAFLPALQTPQRTVVTATRSAAENEQIVFARYFADALSGDGADADKDGTVSIAEAFEYAKREVARFYKDENRLATEHALLSDTTAARAFVLRRGSAGAANPALAAIQRRIDALKARKAQLTASEYDAQLEQLMLELARKTRELRAAGKQP